MIQLLKLDINPHLAWLLSSKPWVNPH